MKGSFTQVPDRTHGEVGNAIREIAGETRSGDPEPIHGFHAMVAGAALVLERNAPHAVYRSHGSKAEDWLRQPSNEWRHMHAAASTALDRWRSGEAMPRQTPEEMMTHIVSDVLLQTRMTTVETAVRYREPAFLEGMPEDDKALVARARHDRDLQSAIHHEAIGSYHRLDPMVQRDRADVMERGENLSPEMKADIALMARMIEAERLELGPRNRGADERIADYQDYGKALFAEVKPEHSWRAAELRDGAEPENRAEIAVAMHAARAKPGVDTGVVGIAQAQLLADFEGTAQSPGDLAVRIESHVRTVQAARDRAFDDLDQGPFQPPAEEEIAFNHVPRDLSPEAQGVLFSNIEGREAVPALAAMRLMVDGHEREQAMLERVKEVARSFDENENERGFTYEGMTRQEAEGFSTTGIESPGTKMRIDPSKHILGVDAEALATQLGDGPYEIARTVLQATEIPNGMGETARGMRPQYEFVGHEGRFPVSQFQHERGEEHVYAAVMMEPDERIWLVPLDDKAEGEGAKAIGRAREITSTLPGTEDALSYISETLRSEQIMVGEFVYRNEAFGRTEGPIQLVTSVWSSRANDAEIFEANAAIDAELKGGATLGHHMHGVAIHAARQAAARQI